MDIDEQAKRIAEKCKKWGIKLIFLSPTSVDIDKINPSANEVYVLFSVHTLSEVEKLVDSKVKSNGELIVLQKLMES